MSINSRSFRIDHRLAGWIRVSAQNHGGALQHADQVSTQIRVGNSAGVLRRSHRWLRRRDHRIAASRYFAGASSTTSLRSSPSDVNGRLSMTRNESSCFLSDKGHSLTV